jgi:fucose permease
LTSHRRLVAATALTITVYGMEATLLGTILPELSKTLTPSQSGNLAGVQSVGLILASLVTGPVLDRLGRKIGVLAGLFIVATALGLLSHASTYSQLLIVLALLGWGGGVLSTSTNTMASDLGGTNQTGLMNLLNCFFGLGGLLTPALGAIFETRLLCGLIVVLAIVSMALHLSNQIPRPAPVSHEGARTIRTMLFSPLFLLLCLFLFLYVAAELGVWNWFASYLTGRGVARSDALHILSFGFATGIILGRMAVSQVHQRFSPASVIVVASVFMLLTTSIMLWVPGTLSAGVAVFFAGLAMAPVYPTTLALVSEAVPVGTATAIGITVTCGWVGVAFSSNLIGRLAGTDPAQLGHALLVIPALSALMIVVSLVVRVLQGKTKKHLVLDRLSHMR